MRTLWSFLSVSMCICHLCISGVEGDGCHTKHNDCCIVCDAGYLLTGKCGTCKPCSSNGYMEHPNGRPTCKQCRICEGIFEYRSRCSTTKDALCKCTAGKKCVDEKCSQCKDDPCPAGTQLTGEDCVTCPPGTYNPGTEGTCQQWKNCSAIDASVYVNGTSTSDVVCLPKPSRIDPTSPAAASSMTTKPVVAPAQGVIVAVVSAIAVTTAAMLVFVGLSLRLEKIKNKFKKINHTEQEDACSCHYPEEEHGGEEETLSTEP